ncbi:Alpha/beta knot methyltransferase, partial [Protomyces lactucae-debilis]
LHYLYGANAALAAIRSKKRTIYNVFNAEVHQESVTSKSILAAARKSNLEVLRKSRNELDRMSLGKPHNNIVLSCSDLPRLLVQGLGDKDQGWRPILANQDPMSASLALSGAEVDTPPVYVLLDEVTDPQNMGSILRSAYFLGCAGVVLSARNCCSITPTVVKVSSGASEFVPILHADSVVSFIKQSRKNGWRCVATVGREEAALLRVKNRLTEVKALKDRKTPVLLILGSEGSGLRTNVKAACTTLTSIASPARIDTTVESLNVGVAAAILLHQLL